MKILDPLDKIITNYVYNGNPSSVYVHGTERHGIDLSKLKELLETAQDNGCVCLEFEKPYEHTTLFRIWLDKPRKAILV